jgi:hypothetical protein
MKKLFFALLFIACFFTNSKATVVIQNGLTHVHSMNSGEVLLGKIVLKNLSKKTERVSVYQNDLEILCSGIVNYNKSGSNPKSLVEFITLNTSDQTLAPNEEFEVSYKISIPSGYDKKGSLWTLIMVEVAEPISEQKVEYGVSIGSKIRYGIQVIANIGENEINKYSFKDVKLLKTENERKIEAILQNEGDFLINPILNIQIFDENGNLSKELKLPSKKLYPSNCQKFEIDIMDLKKGKYNVVLVSESNEESIGVNINLEI